VELGQAELQKTEADIADTDAQYQYRLTRLALAYTDWSAEVSTSSQWNFESSFGDYRRWKHIR
jgi:hypothetical protein